MRALRRQRESLGSGRGSLAPATRSYRLPKRDARYQPETNGAHELASSRACRGEPRLAEADSISRRGRRDGDCVADAAALVDTVRQRRPDPRRCIRPDLDTTTNRTTA